MRPRTPKATTRGKARTTQRAGSAKKAGAKQASAKKANAKKPAVATKGPSPKRKTKQPREKTAPTVAVSEPAIAVSETVVEVVVDASPAAAKKPGALARFKSGVGSLFARMTGRGTEASADESDGVPVAGQTMEIRTEDIVAQDEVAAPSRPARRPPPVPVDRDDD